MAGAVQRNARFAIVVLVNGRHSAGVAYRRRRLWTSSLSWSRRWRGRRRRAANLKSQQSLVVNSLPNGQPVQRVQQRRGVGSSWRLEDDPSSVVLHKLQLPDGVGWSTVEHSVAVIDPEQDQTARQCLCKVRRQQVSNVTVACAWKLHDRATARR